MIDRFVKNAILIDFSWLIHRFYHGYKDLSVEIEGEVIKTGQLYGFTKLIEELHRKNPFSSIVFCLDSPPYWRKKFQADYKAGRDPHKGDLFKMNEVIMNLLAYDSDRVQFVRSEGYEGDDLMADIFFKFKKSGRFVNISLLSEDKDMLQLMPHGACIATKFTGGLLSEWRTEEYCKKKYKTGSNKVLEVKAFRGDTDNLKNNVPNMRASVLNRFIEMMLKDGYDSACENMPKEEYREKFREAKKGYIHNRMMMDLCGYENDPIKLDRLELTLTEKDLFDIVNKFKLKKYGRYLRSVGLVTC